MERRKGSIMQHLRLLPEAHCETKVSDLRTVAFVQNWTWDIKLVQCNTIQTVTLDFDDGITLRVRTEDVFLLDV